MFYIKNIVIIIITSLRLLRNMYIFYFIDGN